MQSALYKKIEGDLTAALKSRDAFAVKVLRFLKSNIDREAKDKMADLTDEEVIRVIQRRIKQSQDSIDKYRQGGREDLASAEQQEMEKIAAYLPPQMPQEELLTLAKRLATELGASGPKDFGKVMGRIMKEVAGKADGKNVKAAVEQALNG